MAQLPSHLYQYLNVMNPRDRGFATDLISYGRLFFRDPLEFNDPFDCRPKLHVGGQGLSELQKEFVEDLKKVGVVSLSEHVDHPLMWAHYGDRHRGVCIEFNASILNQLGHLAGKGGNLDPYLEPVRYQTHYPVMYTDDLRDQAPEVRKSDAIGKAVATKSVHWLYESEWRLISPSLRGAILEIPKAAITRVILGARMPSAHREEFKARHTNVVSASFDPVEFGIVVPPAESLSMVTTDGRK